jgi:hypothetical protein
MAAGLHLLLPASVVIIFIRLRLLERDGQSRMLRQFNSNGADRHILLSLHQPERRYVQDELHHVAHY